MKLEVVTYNELIGFHCWPDAPEEVAFLRYPHRHRFEIRCWFEVNHEDRELEIFLTERKINDYLLKKYGDENGELWLDSTSCETLGKQIIVTFGCLACQVLEDGKGGAIVRR